MTLTGTTDNGIITLDGSAPNGTVESNLRFDGSILSIDGGIIASASTSTDLVRITQTGTGNALVVEDSNNPDISQFVVDATGNVGIGTNTPISKIQISNTSSTISSALYNAGNDVIILTTEGISPGFNIVSVGDVETNRGVFKATRARGTLTTPLVPILNDDTLSLVGAIYDGVTNLTTAGITFDVDGTVTAGTAPQRIVFSTGTASRTERMRIASDGKVGIGVNAPTTPLHVRATNSPSTNETIARFDVSDASTAYFGINNGSTLDGVFVPEIIGRQASTTGLNSVTFGGYIDTLQDSGTSVPVTIFRSAVAGGTTVSTRPLFDFRNWTTSAMLISATGNVGIANTSPSEKLHISGNTRIDGNLIVSGSTQSLFSGNSSEDLVRITQTGAGNAFVVEDSTNPDSTPFLISSDGNIGMGTASPSTKVHIFSTTSGALRIVDGTQQSGYVLKSDANGLATWQPEGAAIANYGNNRVITSDGTTTGLVGETNMTFDGNQLGLTGSMKISGTFSGSNNNYVSANAITQTVLLYLSNNC